MRDSLSLKDANSFAWAVFVSGALAGIASVLLTDGYQNMAFTLYVLSLGFFLWGRVVVWISRRLPE